MTIADPQVPARLPSSWGNQRYRLLRATEASDRDVVSQALRIHADGYRSMGFVRPDAITAEGVLHPEIDRSRGGTTEYYVAVRRSSTDDCATVRKVGVPVGGSFRDLDCHQLCADSLYSHGVDYLVEAETRRVRLKELSGLARSRGANPMATYEVLRSAVRDGLRDGEVWYSCIVSKTLESLVRNLGSTTFTVIGGEVALSDPRVAPNIRLRPIVIETATSLDSILDDYQGATDPRAQRRILRSFLFFTEGLDASMLTPRVHAARAHMSTAL